MSRPLESRTRQRRRCISRSKTSTQSSHARKRSAASLERMCTASPAAPSACGRGASDRSTPRINGRTRCASSRPGRSIRADVQRRIATILTQRSPSSRLVGRTSCWPGNTRDGVNLSDWNGKISGVAILKFFHPHHNSLPCERAYILKANGLL